MAVTPETASDLRDLAVAVDLLTFCEVVTHTERDELRSEADRFMPWRATVGFTVLDGDGHTCMVVGDLRLDEATAIAVAGKSIERAHARLLARHGADEEWDQLLELARLATRRARVAALRVGVARLGVAAGVRRPLSRTGVAAHAAHAVEGPGS